MDSGYQPQGNAPVAGERSTPPRADMIPLVCFICPKNSHFSDLSHLLTHISSKGHLHNMFQLKLASELDEDARLAVTKFEAWYKQNGIPELLRARKSAREQRDNHQRRNQAPSNFGRNTAMVSRQSTRNDRPNRRVRGNNKIETQHRDEAMAVLNENDVVKFESDDDEVPAGRNKHEYHSAIHAPYIWPSGVPYSNNPSHYSNSPGAQFQDYLEDEDDSSKYDPSELYSPFPAEDTPETVEDDTGALILKGVVYPGMAGFDSATERDRRMRNQKKDPAVLLKLEANSQLVTRTEEVLDTNLDYQRTRDVYDEPSLDGSGDENDFAISETRIKRRAKAKSSSTSVRRRSNTKSRPQTQLTERARPFRSLGRKARSPSASVQSAIPTRRITRSSTNRREQLPLHNHGVHPDPGALRDCEGELDDEDFRRTHIHTSVAGSLRRPQHNRLPGLALRPGNPNAAFASPTSGFKKSPPHYAGKENSHLLIKSPPSFNPYLHPSGDSIEVNNYNPLCSQPRDGFGYRLYSPYDDEPKSSTSSGFNPINSSSTYDPTHISGMTGNPYHHSQASGDDYQL